MNLPKGPDTLCFDKDEFMKVRAGLRARGWPARRCPRGRPRASARGPSAGTALPFAVSLPPQGGRCSPGRALP